MVFCSQVTVRVKNLNRVCQSTCILLLCKFLRVKCQKLAKTLSKIQWHYWFLTYGVLTQGMWVLSVWFSCPPTSTLNMIFSVVWSLQLHILISSNYQCDFSPSEDVNVTQCPNNSIWPWLVKDNEMHSNDMIPNSKSH